MALNGAQAKELKGKYLYGNIKTYFEEPLVLAEGTGSRVRDTEGRDYLDFFGGILTVSVGHAHPAVTKAIQQQAARMTHTSTCYLNEPMLRLAERLASITPGRLQKCFFTNSGTEANETAIHTARACGGCQEIIALRHSYHGRSALATALTGNWAWRPGGSVVPGIIHAHNPYCYRCPFGATYEHCDVACARDLEELIRTTTSGRVAGFIAEPIQGVGGFITPPPDYFRVAVDIVRRYGGVFICDEVQTGFGRTGRHFFGIQHWGVEPEIMTFAKGLANGSPIGATIAVPEVADAFQTSSISTFGGNPVSMAAALATLDVLEPLPDHVEEMGRILQAGLRDLQDRYTCIGDVRGLGLMIGVEMVGGKKAPAPDVATRLMDCARQEGLLVGKGGLYGNTLRLTPPMTVTEAEVREGLEKLGRAFARLNCPGE